MDTWSPILGMDTWSPILGMDTWSPILDSTKSRILTGQVRIQGMP